VLIRERITFVFWLVLSLYFCIESYRLGLGSVNAPGPGFFPFWASLLVGLLAVVLVLQERRKKLLADVAPLFKGKNLRNIIYAYLFLFGYAGLLDKIGVFLCTLLFIGFCLKVLGAKKWKIVIWFSLSGAVFAYMVFNYWLAIPFPKGEWLRRFLSLGDHLWK
jgi:putative tricarboxylic transport membrane protein